MAARIQELPPMDQMHADYSSNVVEESVEPQITRRKLISDGLKLTLGGIATSFTGAVLIDNSQDQQQDSLTRISNLTPANSPVMEGSRDFQYKKLDEAKSNERSSRALLGVGLIFMMRGIEIRRRELEIRDNNALADQLKPTEIFSDK